MSTPGDYYDLARVRPEVLAVLNRINELGPIFAERAFGIDQDASFPVENYKDLAAEELMSGAQVKKFLILHKELDADDGELTRTQKVRRNIIADKYADLIAALYDGSSEIYTETEVTYEDGRKGSISATLQIVDAVVQSKREQAA